MRVLWILTGILAAASASCAAQTNAAAEDPAKLVREVVYNEQHDHDGHGYWRYWVEHRGAHGARTEEQVETPDGVLGRMLLANGRPLDAGSAQAEEDRLRELVNSPSEQARMRQAYAEDEKRIGRILSMLPDAFVYQDGGTENGCRHLRYAPNPRYAARTIEAKVFHALSGELWIDTRMKRMTRLDGRLNDNLDFGMGLLGRVNRGSWFRLVRAQVSAKDWKTSELEVHMSGRALFFKTVGRETSEVRGGFQELPSSISVAQGVGLLERTDAKTATFAAARIAPVALVETR